MTSGQLHLFDLGDYGWLEALLAQGYSSFCERHEQWCAIKRFSFTTAVVVGLSRDGYERRYCFEHEHEASESLAIWDGRDHPVGPWIKCKGHGIDLLNPALTC